MNLICGTKVGGVIGAGMHLKRHVDDHAPVSLIEECVFKQYPEAIYDEIMGEYKPPVKKNPPKENPPKANPPQANPPKKNSQKNPPKQIPLQKNPPKRRKRLLRDHQKENHFQLMMWCVTRD